MKDAAVGATIRNATDRPPWIVVGPSVESAIVARWPGKLWRVEVLEAAHEQAGGAANYTRAVAVRVLESEPVARLFGSHGEAVCRVIDTACGMGIEDVQTLARGRHDLAREAYSKAWKAWLGKGSPATAAGAEHAGTLEVVSLGGGNGSPIGAGFSVLDRVIFTRARALIGNAAFMTDKEGDEYLEPAWATASEVFLHAAMGYGAPELVSGRERELLISSWSKHYQPS